MEKTDKEVFSLEGPKGILPIKPDDKPAVLLAMLFEGKCLGLGGAKAAKKYGYSKQRYFQVLNAFKEGGLEAITPKKTGPKGNSIRTENLVTQIVRHRFLDPDATTEVIAQKMQQTGYKISIRSVERTITEFGLQKKTLQVSTARGRTGS